MPYGNRFAIGCLVPWRSRLAVILIRLSLSGTGAPVSFPYRLFCSILMRTPPARAVSTSISAWAPGALARRQ